MKLFLFLSLFGAISIVSSAFVCLTGCDEIPCTDAVTKEACHRERGIFEKFGGGTCGCCPYCYNEIPKGGRCLAILSALLGVPATGASRCANGTFCDPKTGKCEELPIGPKQCKDILKKCNERECHCLDELCRRIRPFTPRQNASDEDSGYTVPIAEADSMSCRCARKKFNYREKHLIGLMFNCDFKTGNFSPLQCYGSFCWCTDERGRPFWKTWTRISNIRNMTCFGERAKTWNNVDIGS